MVAETPYFMPVSYTHLQIHFCLATSGNPMQQQLSGQKAVYTAANMFNRLLLVKG